MENQERKHNSACENAEHERCTCSCNGSLHGISGNGSSEIPIDPVKRMGYINKYYSLCEYSFVPFPHGIKNPKFALGADVYAHIPSKSSKKYKERNHALAIWKDIETKEFVVRKEFQQRSIITFVTKLTQIAEMITNNSTGSFEEVYRGNDFQKALDMCTIYGHKYWGHETEWKACDHGDYMQHCCKNWKVKV